LGLNPSTEAEAAFQKHDSVFAKAQGMAYSTQVDSRWRAGIGEAGQGHQKQKRE
jgi:hypothetical protein